MILNKKKNLVALMVAGALGISACSGGGGLPDPYPTMVMSGKSYDAKIVNGVIDIYALTTDENGDLIKSKLLDSVRTDENGQYEAGISHSNTAVLLEVDGKNGGYYVEEASGVTVNLKAGDKLTAITMYEGQSMNVVVTPLTHMAAGKVEYLVKEQGVALSNAITQASTSLTAWTGFDILGTDPIDVTDPANAVGTPGDGEKYGYFAAALSVISNEANLIEGWGAHEKYRSIGVAQTYYNDIKSDGLLDGIGMVNGQMAQLSVGAITTITTDTYRSGIGRAIISFVGSPKNALGLTTTSLYQYANEVSSDTSDNFGGVTPAPLDDLPPVVQLNHADGDWFNRVAVLSGSTSDVTGIQKIEWWLNGAGTGTLLGEATDMDAPTFNFNTVGWDGSHTLTLRAYDMAGNIGDATISITVDNAGPSGNVTSASLINTLNHTLTGTVNDSGSGIASITVNGSPAVVNGDTFSLNLTLQEGVNPIDLVFTDNLGNVRNIANFISVDMGVPEISGMLHSNKSLVGGGTVSDPNAYDVTGHGALLFSAEGLRLNGAVIDRSNLSNIGIPFYAFTVTDPASSGVSTPDAGLTVEIQVSAAGSIVEPWRSIPAVSTNPAGNEYVIPLTEEVLGTEWHRVAPSERVSIAAKIVDMAGNNSIFSMEFLADVRPVVPSSITADDLAQSHIASVNFANRSLLNNDIFTGFEYQFKNTSGQDVWVDASGFNAGVLNKSVSQGRRENYRKLRTIYQWKQQGGSFDPLVGLYGTCTLGPVTYDLPATIGYTYNNGIDYATLTAPKPADVVSASKAVFSDIPVPPASSSWVELGRAYWEAFAAPLFPASSLPVDYVEGVGVVGSGGVYGNPDLSPYYDCGTSYQREHYSYDNVAGYPKNVSGPNLDTVHPLTIDGIKVVGLNSGTDLASANGSWYLVPAGETAVISVDLKLPAVPQYIDAIIGSTDAWPYVSGNSGWKKFDRSYSYAFDYSKNFSFVHGVTDTTKIGAMTRLTKEVIGTSVATISR